MNYLQSNFVAGNGATIVLHESIPIGIAGFIHSNPGAKTASLQVGAANYHGKKGENIAYANNGAGKARYTLADHGLTTGDFVFITGPALVDGFQEVTATAAGTFDTDMAYVGAGASDATVYTAQKVFKVASFTEYVLNSVVGPFAAYEVLHHAATGGDTNILWRHS